MMMTAMRRQPARLLTPEATTLMRCASRTVDRRCATTTAVCAPPPAAPARPPPRPSSAGDQVVEGFLHESLLTKAPPVLVGKKGLI